MGTMTNQKSHIVAFRIDDDLMARIDADCKQFSVPRAPWLRGIVSSHYCGSDDEALTSRLDELAGSTSQLSLAVTDLRQELLQLRQDLRRVLWSLLMNIGAIDARQANKLVTKALGQETE